MTDTALLAGRVALVTGSAGRGMGRSTALTLARDGADIVINYGTHRDAPDDAAAVARAVEAFGRRALVCKASVVQPDEVKAMVEQAIAAFGRLDILVNNAGGGWRLADLPDIADERWRAVVQAEIDGAFYPIKYALPHMRRQRWGRIVNICGFRNEAWDGPPYDYMAGKVGRLQLTRQLVENERRHGITVNAVCPGTIDGLDFDAAQALTRHSGDWPDREWPTPQDTAEVIAFLCSEAGRFVSGSVIGIPGRAKR